MTNGVNFSNFSNVENYNTSANSAIANEKQDKNNIFNDFSSKMRDEYNFQEKDIELVWSVLDSANIDELDDEQFDNVMKIFS